MRLQEWMDAKLIWDPEEYGGVRELMVPSDHIWLPDIVLYNKYVQSISNPRTAQRDKASLLRRVVSSLDAFMARISHE